MPSSLIVAFIIVAIVTPYVHSLFRQWQLREKERQWGCEPPGKYRHTLPFGIDNQRAWLKAAKTNRFNRRNIDLFNKYGFTYESTIWQSRYIHTRDLENLKTMLALKHDDYSRMTPQAKSLEQLAGPGLLFSDGAEWKQSRDLVTPLFKKAEMSDLGRLKRHVDKLISLLPRDSTTINFAPLLVKFAVDNSSEFIFGQSFNSLDGDDGEGVRFLALQDEANSLASRQAHVAGGRYMFFQGRRNTKLKQKIQEVHSIVETWVERAVHRQEARHATASSSSNGSPTQETYILVDEMAKEIRDTKRLRSELLNIFAPSKGNMSSLMMNAFFYLARHPNIWQQVRQQALDLGDGPITWETLKSLVFFRYVFQEAIRLQGPSGQVQRVAIRDTVLPRGGGPDGSSPILVPKGTVVSGYNFPIYHDPKIWGDDVEEFKPSRYEGRVFQWEFVPFMGGPRICPAQPFVWTTAVYLLYRMALEFETLENKDPCWEYYEEITMSVRHKNGVLVALHPAPCKS